MGDHVWRWEGWLFSEHILENYLIGECTTLIKN